MAACEVCGRTILKGERTEPYVVPDGSLRQVCDLCVRRAEGAGWIRESAHRELPAEVPGTEQRRSLLSRLRQRYENGPRVGDRQREPSGAVGAEEPVDERPEVPWDEYEEAAEEGGSARAEPERYAGEDGAREQPWERSADDRLSYEDVSPAPERYEPSYRSDYPEADIDAADPEAELAAPDPDEDHLDADAYPGHSLPGDHLDDQRESLGSEEGNGEDPYGRSAYGADDPYEETAADERGAEEPSYEGPRRRRERRARGRVRDPRQVRAIPTGAEAKVERALEIFNGSDYRRTVGGLVRTLGDPWVTALPLIETPSEVTIVVAWELSWYQYRVDLSDTVEPVALLRKGTELDELETELREWNVTTDAEGALVPGAPA